MSKIKISLVAIALVLISGFAIAGDNKTESKTTSKAKSGTVLYWFNPAVTVYQAANTTADEEARTGCDGETTQICEKGFAKSQLVDENDPSQGIQSGQEGSYVDQIRVHQN